MHQLSVFGELMFQHIGRRFADTGLVELGQGGPVLLLEAPLQKSGDVAHRLLESGEAPLGRGVGPELLTGELSPHRQAKDADHLPRQRLGLCRLALCDDEQRVGLGEPVLVDGDLALATVGHRCAPHGGAHMNARQIA